MLLSSRAVRSLFVLVAALGLAPAANAGPPAGANVPYTVDGQPYEGFFVSPAPGAPLVMLIHDWDGLTAYEEKRAAMLAEQGYAVFAADLFGAGVRPTKVEDKRQHTGELYTDRGKMRRLLDAALAAARERGADTGNAVAAGYCFGGAAVLEWARAGAPLKGFVTFHGGLGTPPGQDYRKVQAPVLVFHGSADTAVTLEQFAALAADLEAAGVPHELTTLGGAPHAFTVFGSPRYREAADRRSWTRFLEFLGEVLR